MPLTPGSRIGPYEVVARLGAGGMGEVYRARDPKLNRDLAIKVLPAALSRDEGFLIRFQAEARAASSLNHPNIITIHDIGSADGHSYILMELVEGRTVRELTEPGAMPLKKTLQIAAQAAEGLAAAHARGIVHRDLKPENLMVSRDGVVKILDFGLAKTVTAEASAEDRTLSAGVSQTEPGTVLGTVGYMSPEQASGQPVDFRGDQFSLGTIVYEMVAGKRAWRRKTPAESLVAIIREEPEPLASAAPDTPTALRWIVERCLAKDPEDRYAATKDLARDLRALSDHFSDLTTGGSVQGVHAPAAKRHRTPAVWTAAGGALVLGAAAAWLLRPAPPLPTPPRPSYLTYSGRESEPAMSPDGRVLAFSSERTRQKRIWLKQLADGSEAVLTSGPDRAPRFSPDGASILFTRTEAPGKQSLYRIPVVGGEPRRVVENAFLADYSPDGRQIVFLRSSNLDGNYGYEILVAPATGSPGKVLHRIDALTASAPRWSPDGRFVSVAYSLTGALGGIPWRIAIVPSAGGPARTIAPDGKHGMVSTALWSGDGRDLVYAQLDPGYFPTSGRIVRQELSGATRVLFGALNLGLTLDYAGDGGLVYQADSIRGNLRQQNLPTGGRFDEGQDPRWLTRGYGVDRQPAYSPDGQRVVFTSNRDGNMNIWELTLATGAVRRLTDDPADDWDPFVTRDGQHLLWSSNRSGNYEIWIAGADGTNPRQLSHDRDLAQAAAGGRKAGVSAPGEPLGDAENPTVTPDGQWVVYGAYGAETAGVWRIRIDGSEPKQMVAGTFRDPNLSPDGRFVGVIDLHSAPRMRILRLEDGQFLPFVRDVQVDPATAQATARLRWGPDGRSVFVGGLDDRGFGGVFREDFNPSGPQSTVRKPVAGFDADYRVDGFAVSPDGRRITLAVTEQPSDLVLIEGLGGLPPPPRRTAP